MAVAVVAVVWWDEIAVAVVSCSEYYTKICVRRSDQLALLKRPFRQRDVPPINHPPKCRVAYNAGKLIEFEVQRLLHEEKK